MRASSVPSSKNSTASNRGRRDQARVDGLSSERPIPLRSAPIPPKPSCHEREKTPMNAHTKLPQDIVGLAHMVPPLSRRGFFMSASAAAAAGYTLAAGPVRAEAIKTDTNGLTVGDAKVKVEGGEMP